MITLRDVTEENLCDCEALQRKSTLYVGGPLWVIAQAYVHRQNTTAHAIYFDDTIVGLVCLIWDLHGEYSFSDLFIADNYQGLRYGKEAVKAIINLFEKEKRHPSISI